MDSNLVAHCKVTAISEGYRALVTEKNGTKTEFRGTSPK